MNIARVVKVCDKIGFGKLRLGNNQFSTSAVLCRDEFIRDKSIVNLVTLGAGQHGKTTLASRLTKVLASHGVPVKEVAEIDNNASEKENCRSEQVTHMELWRDQSKWRYSLADLPGNFAYIKNTLNHLPHADGALLVISPEDGIVPETKLFYYMASHLEIPFILPVISMRGTEVMDQETVELIMMEMEELEGIRKPFILDDPMNNDNCLIKLMDEIDELTALTVSEREVDKPLFMALEQVGSIPKRGEFCAGRVLQGKVAVGDQVEAFYQGKTSKANVKDMEIYKKGTSFLQAGDRGGAFLKLKTEMDLKRGGVLYDPKSKVSVSDVWEISLKSVPGFGPATLKGDAVFYSSTVTDGKVSLGGYVDIVEDVEQVVKVKLSNKIIGKPGDKVILRNNKVISLGTIVA